MKSISLVLTPKSAVADGNQHITADAQVIVNGTYPSSEPVTFSLNGSTSATILDSNNSKEKIAYTNVMGKATVYFTDTVVEQGNISATMTNSPDKYDTENFDFTGTAYIDLSVDNNYATAWNDVNSFPDESSIIYAVVTVRELAANIQANLTFQIDGAVNAWFVDKTNPSAHPRVYNTRVSGGQTIKVGIADSNVEVGLVSVSGTTDSMQPLQGTPQEFSFTSVSLTSCQLDLINNGAKADGQSMITAAATAFVNGTRAADKGIYLEITPNNCGAYFLPGPGITLMGSNKIAYGNTNSSGEFSVQFIDKIWETGNVTASLANSEATNIEKEFFFDVPSDLLINVISLVKTTSGTPEWVEFNMAAADGLTKQNLFVELKNTAGSAYPNALVQLDIDGVGNFPYKQANGVAISNNGRTAIVSTQLDGLTPLIGLVSLEQGTCSITAKTPPDELKPATGQSRSQTHICNFNDPWTSVSSVQTIFTDGTERTRLLYANGRHQTSITVSIQAATPSGDMLLPMLLPPNPFDTAKLVDYVSGCELGVGDFSNWRYSKDSSGSKFTAPLADKSAVETIVEAASLLSSQNYYITSLEPVNNNKSNYKSGLVITPTGPQVISTGIKGKYGYYVGANMQTPPLMFVQYANPITSLNQVAINLLPPITYYKDNFASLGINSYKGPSNTSLENISLYPDNYYRQWDYTIEIKDGKYSNYIYECLLSDLDQLPKDYAVAETRRNIYNYKLYVWPNNIMGKDGKKLISQSTYTMSSDDINNINISSIKDILGAIQVTLFCSFGLIEIGTSSSTPINIKVFDQYGNSGEFHIDGTMLPMQYDANELGQLNFLNDNKTTEIIEPIKGSNVGQIVTSFYSATVSNMRVGHDNTQNFNNDNEVILNTGDQIKFELINKSGFKYYINNNKCGYMNYSSKNDPIFYDKDKKSVFYFSPLWINDSMVITFNDNNKSLYAGYITETGKKTVYTVFAGNYDINFIQYQWSISTLS